MRCTYQGERQISTDVGVAVAEQGGDAVCPSDVVDDFWSSRLSDQDGKAPQMDLHTAAQQYCATELAVPPKEAECSSVCEVEQSILTEPNRLVSAKDHSSPKQKPIGGLEENSEPRQPLVNEKRSSPCLPGARHVETSVAPSLPRYLVN